MTDQEVMKDCEKLAQSLTYMTNDLRQRGYEVELKSMRTHSLGGPYAELYTVEAYKHVRLTGDTKES